MAIDWHRVRAAPLEAVEHGVVAADVTANDPYVGPRTFDRIDYPAGEIIPQNTTRTDGNEFQHTIFANLYFERSRSLDYVADVLHPVAAVIDEVLSALSSTECVVTYVPGEIQDYAGELDNTSVLLVTIRFEITTLVDLAET
jgi:hypothetical protein